MIRFLRALLIAATLLMGNTAVADDDAADLTRMLNEFLAGASINDAAAHDRFWAEDLIYTGSSGERIGKADIMSGFSAPAKGNNAEADTADAEAGDAEKTEAKETEAEATEAEETEAEEAATVYTAEEIRIQQYGDTAIVAFKLVATASPAGDNAGAASEVSYYYNTGAFLRRNGAWQAVAWQATRIPAAP
jgi:hypothetical protein